METINNNKRPPEFDGALFQPKNLERDRAFKASSKTSHYWCQHCERAYKKGFFRLIKGLQMCPYKGCDGDAVIDARCWSFIQDIHQGSPKTPKVGEVYSLWG